MRFILLVISLLTLEVIGQNTIGLPDVTNYIKQSYRAGLQNWDLKQDKNGIIYAANNEGLLSFDGSTWMLYNLPNKTIVRSLEIAPDKIYVGGQDEFGYFSPQSNGELRYTDLTKQIPEKFRQFGDVWDIILVNGTVMARTNSKIFKFSGEAVVTYDAPLEWSYLGYCNSVIYAHDYRKGILKWINNQWEPLNIAGFFPADDPVTSVMPLGNDSILICTLKNGLYISDGKQIVKKETEQEGFFQKARIYGAVPMGGKGFAFATNNNGICILDNQLNLVQRFSKTEAVQNNNVLSVLYDREGNLWLGLDNGISFIAFNSPIKQVNPEGQDGAGYAVGIYNNVLYLGTSSGLYSTALQNGHSDLSFSRGRFTEVENTKGQVWRLSVINNQVLMGHHEGAFLIKNNHAERFSTQVGFWDFVPLSNILPVQKMMAGTYKGLVFFDWNGQQFSEAGAVGKFTESSRYITTDNEGNYWVSHPYHGVYKLSKNEYGSYTEKMYTYKNGLPSILNNHIYKIRNEVLAATEKGIYKYNQQKDAFEPHAAYQKILGQLSVRYLKDDLSGNTWFIHEKQLGVIDYSSREPFVIYLPELDRKMLSGFEFIYPVDRTNTFLGGEKGFFHINYEKYKKSVPNPDVMIRQVKISAATDSIIFGGYFDTINSVPVQQGQHIVEVENKWKTIRFQFSSTMFGSRINLEYSYQLENFDGGWSEWSSRTEKEYTNLPAGRYNFRVKVRSNPGNESKVTIYSFVILPAWYETLLAKIIYLFGFFGILFIFFRWQQKKIKEHQLKHEQEQKKLQYIHELELNKTASELVELKNEKLEAEINFKNSELASSAMHLVKKGELMAKIKTDLHGLIKNIGNEQAAVEIRKLLKTLGDDEKADADWDSFAQHFDKVHSDFTRRLKQRVPSLTTTEMKLCAYLRMNLSTKEIARLMNISVRGVEIGRYRLRKKLEIPTETTLFDYLIEV